MAKGHKTGGRTKGTPNRSTAQAKAEAAASGEMPLDYMLRVMRDKTVDHARRDTMAAKAAPYLHAALKSVEVSGPEGGPIPVVISKDDADL